jgi:hypothetical protein
VLGLCLFPLLLTFPLFAPAVASTLNPPSQARNILLKSSGGAEGRPFVAKVADFGLSMRIDPNATHVSNVYQVRDRDTHARACAHGHA